MLRQTGFLLAVLCALVCASFAAEKYQQPGPIHLDREVKSGGENPAPALDRRKSRPAFHDLGARGVSEHREPRVSAAWRQYPHARL
jgi:hypothetical protein